MVPGICTEWFGVERLENCDSAVAVLAQQSVDEAISWIFRMTGSQFIGTCTTTLWPWPKCDRHGQRCGCGNLERYDLSLDVSGTVSEIVEVVVDGDTVPTTDYWLGSGRWLIPMRDGALWPWPEQDLHAAAPRWSVTVEHGTAPPPEVVRAAVILAEQLLAKATGAECDLPDNATSISKDGMSIQLAVPTDGKTGIPLVDSIVAMYRRPVFGRAFDPLEVSAVTG